MPCGGHHGSCLRVECRKARCGHGVGSSSYLVTEPVPGSRITSTAARTGDSAARCRGAAGSLHSRPQTQACNRFRSSELQQLLPGTPIVLLVTREQFESTLRRSSAGGAYIISKPWSNDELLAKVQRLLQLQAERVGTKGAD